MKINWLYAKDKNGDFIFYEFKNELNILINDNNAGKTLLAAQILHALGVSYDLSKENMKEHYITISIIHNDKEVVISRHNNIFKAYSVKEDIIFSDKKTPFYKKIFEILGIDINPFSRNIFKSFLNPTTIMQTTRYKMNGFIEFHGKENTNDNVYYYIAKAFYEHEKAVPLLLEVNKVESEIKVLKKEIERLAEDYKIISKYEWTDHDIELTKKLANISSEMEKVKNRIVKFVSERNISEEKLLVIENNHKFASAWRNEMKGLTAMINGQKVTISEFLKEFDDVEGTKMKNSKEHKAKITQLSSKIEESQSDLSFLLKEFKILKDEITNKDNFLIRGETNDIEKTIFSTNAEIEQLKSKKKRKYKDLKKILENKPASIISLLESIDPNINDYIGSMNQKGVYNWLIINPKSRTGSSVVDIQLAIIMAGQRINGFESPVIMDSSDEPSDKDNLKLFQEKVKSISTKNQTILFSNKRGIWQDISATNEIKTKSFSGIDNNIREIIIELSDGKLSE